MEESSKETKTFKIHKTNARGSLQVWEAKCSHTPDGAAMIEYSWGQAGGKIQINKIAISTGKQSRTPFQQAVLEARSKYQRKLREGYIDGDEPTEVLSPLPMLAFVYEKRPKRAIPIDEKTCV